MNRCCFFLFVFLFPILSQAQNPSVVGSFPREGTQDIIRNAFISVVLNLPNGGLDPRTVNDSTIRLYPEGYPDENVRAFVSFKNDLRNITLEPYFLLQANAAYVFEITDQVSDLSGAPMVPYQFTFTTGTVSFRKRITMNRNKAFGESLEEEEEMTEEEALAEAMGEFQTPAEKAAEKAEDARRGQLPALARANINPGKYGQSPRIGPTRPPQLPRPRLMVATVTMEEILAMPDPYPELPELAAITPASQGPEIRTQGQTPGEVARLQTDPELEEKLKAPVMEARPEYRLSQVQPDMSMFVLDNELSPIYLPVPYRVDQLPLPMSMAELAAMPDPYPEEMDLEDLPSADDLPSDEDLAGNSETLTEVVAGKSTKGVIVFPQGTIYKNQKLDIEFTFEEKEYVSFVLRTYDGQVMLTESGFVNPGTNLRAVPTEGVPPGTYYAVVETANQKVTRKVIILQ